MFFEHSEEPLSDLGSPDAEAPPPAPDSNIDDVFADDDVGASRSTSTTSEDDEEDLSQYDDGEEEDSSEDEGDDDVEDKFNDEEESAAMLSRNNNKENNNNTANSKAGARTAVGTTKPKDDNAAKWVQQPPPPPQSNVVNANYGMGSVPPPVNTASTTARNTAITRRLSNTLQGRPLLYETTGDEETLCNLNINTINVQFYEHAVMVRTRDKRWCFPSSKSMIILPRYKLTDVQTGSGARPVPWWATLFYLTGLILLVCSFLVGDLSSGYDDDDLYSSSSFYGGSFRERRRTAETIKSYDTALLVTGIVLMVVGFAVVYYYKCSGKAYHYKLIYSSDGKGSWLSRRTYDLFALSNEKLDEDFLYSYIYETIEQTKDPKFLHRFTHLNQAGLMDPTHGDKRQLLTKPLRRPVGAELV